jgi:hypothetical protein
LPGAIDGCIRRRRCEVGDVRRQVGDNVGRDGDRQVGGNVGRDDDRQVGGNVSRDGDRHVAIAVRDRQREVRAGLGAPQVRGYGNVYPAIDRSIRSGTTTSVGRSSVEPGLSSAIKAALRGLQRSIGSDGGRLGANASRKNALLRGRGAVAVGLALVAALLVRAADQGRLAIAVVLASLDGRQ